MGEKGAPGPLRVAWHLVKLGARLSAWDALLAYVVLPLALLHGAATHEMFVTNARVQLAWFALVVQLPGLLTGKMSFVDIGWPGGLCALSITCWQLGQGWWLRKAAVSACLGLHGLRMFLGALVLFFPFTFPSGDLPRYQFAKKRWIELEGLPAWLWPFKQQQETLSQCLANCVVLATPIMLLCANAREEVHAFELLGLAFWVASWAFENLADVQKLRFDAARRAAAKSASEQRKLELRTAVLGFGEWSGDQFWAWSVSRHPNYAAELCVWLSYCLAALPSLVELAQREDAPWVAPVCALGLLAVARFFYDCLVFWTGAEPAEFGSLARRPQYKDYQAKVPVLLPLFFCRAPFKLTDPHLQAGWPYPEVTLAKQR
jgi:steroid 5-alpha reductase family enzyme